MPPKTLWTRTGYVESLDRLIGKTVLRLFIGPDENTLALDVGGTFMAIDTEGDRCSETWFADIVGMDELRGYPIIAAERIDVPERFPQTNDRSRQEEDEHYAIRLTTASGTCDIIYRNSSNGYYCGWSYVAENTLAALPDGYTEIVGDEWSA